ncbi:MAG TPA: isoprenylcysteine carboxylmethyltransferase family protein, partial [Mizugakiibacter sp.]
MNNPIPGYGLWALALVNAAFFIFFAWSFFTPTTRRDWRSLGLFSAFIVALFAEMYGFPLTLFLLSGWLSSRFPGVNWVSHDAGHLFDMMFGWSGDPHFGLFHIASYLLIGGGFWLLAAAWPVLYRAQREGRIAREGPYAHV